MNYGVITQLGAGNFSKVFKVKSSVTGTLFAAKIARSLDGKELMKSEAYIHSRLIHPNILQFVTSFYTNTCGTDGLIPLINSSVGTCSVIILELCETGTIASFALNKGTTSMLQISLWGSQIASGLLYLKEQGIIHRDIKPENIMFCSGNVKIGDFGLADLEENLVKQAGNFHPPSGTPLYMPTEAFDNIYGFYTDIFAFGVVLYQLYVGRRPFMAESVAKLRQAVDTKEVTFPIMRPETERDTELEALIFRMLSRKFELRPNIKEIIDHPFFNPDPLEDTILMDIDNDDVDDGVMNLARFKALKAEFGDGLREHFYAYLANLNPTDTPMSWQVFTNMWNKLSM
jgi:serine/threonine protein kinase